MSFSLAERARRATPRFLTSPMTPRRLWLITFLAFVLLGWAWSLAMPYDGPADELQHVLRAYGVWSGQIHPSSDLIRVPQSLIPNGLNISFSCFRWNHAMSAHCAATAGANSAQIHQFVLSQSNAWNYSPVYYALVGWPIRIWPTYTGIILARLLTTLFMSAFIASAVSVVARLKHGRWLLTGMLVVLTPVVVNLEGGVNPAGPEIVVGLALWAALIGIIDADQPSPRLVRLALVSATFLAVFRSFGLGWLVLILGAAGLGLTLPRARRLLADRSLRRTFYRWAPLSLVAVVFGYLWTHVTGGVGPIGSGPILTKMSQGQVDLDELWTRSTYYTQGFIGLTSYGDVPTPELVFYIWFGACSVLIALALAICSWRNRVRIAGIIVASYAVLMYPDSETVMHGWWVSQGRYALPFIVGAPMLAAYLLGEHKVLAWPHLRKLTRLLALIVLPIQLLMLYLTMIRFQSGGRHINVLRGSWLPPLGVELPLLLCCAGIVVAWYAVCRLTPVEAELGVPIDPGAGDDRAHDTGVDETGAADAADTGTDGASAAAAEGTEPTEAADGAEVPESVVVPESVEVVGMVEVTAVTVPSQSTAEPSVMPTPTVA